MENAEATAPASTSLFSELNLSEKMLKTVSELGFTTPTPIQQQAIPLAASGKDLIGLAQTGTGKTAAFAIPMIERLMDNTSKFVRALVLAPTRELADQIHQTVKELTRGTQLHSVVIFGGVSHQRQLDELRRKPSIVVACPGRLLDHIQGRSIDLSHVEMLVVDEADRMCDMGFLPDVRRIAKYTPKERQTLLFSATMPAEVEAVTRELLTEPEVVRVAINRPVASITHGAYRVDERAKGELLQDWFGKNEETRVVVFTEMKHVAKKVAEKLSKGGVRATSLHGNLSQGKRKEAIDGFRKGRYAVLVATDIAARGIDVEGVTHVLNYDMPMNLDSYIHRAGRAGRASRTGEAISFVTRHDRRLVRSIEEYLGTSLLDLGAFTPTGSDAPVKTRTRAERAPHSPVVGEDGLVLEGADTPVDGELVAGSEGFTGDASNTSGEERPRARFGNREDRGSRGPRAARGGGDRGGSFRRDRNDRGDRGASRGGSLGGGERRFGERREDGERDPRRSSFGDKSSFRGARSFGGDRAGGAQRPWEGRKTFGAEQGERRERTPRSDAPNTDWWKNDQDTGGAPSGDFRRGRSREGGFREGQGQAREGQARDGAGRGERRGGFSRDGGQRSAGRFGGDRGGRSSFQGGRGGFRGGRSNPAGEGRSFNREGGDSKQFFEGDPRTQGRPQSRGPRRDDDRPNRFGGNRRSIEDGGRGFRSDNRRGEGSSDRPRGGSGFNPRGRGDAPFKRGGRSFEKADPR